MSNKRIVIHADLRPIAGSRFQPTGFPDLGAAVFDRPVGGGESERMLLVESPQSMANHLEGTAWDGASNQPVSLFERLPYIRVLAADDGRYLTSSRTEAHRLSSAFVRDSKLDGRGVVDIFNERLGLRDDTPLDQRKVAAAVFALDPFCLLHGVFFADKKILGQPKIARAITGVVEASGVKEAISGGVKKDDVRHSVNGKDGGTAEGYGTVPFSRIEYTAEQIRMTFSIDLAQLDSYGLPHTAREMLELIALWEVAVLLHDPLRLRTACDLEVVSRDDLDDRVSNRKALEQRIAGCIAELSAELPEVSPIDVVWAGPEKTKSAT